MESLTESIFDQGYRDELKGGGEMGDTNNDFKNINNAFNTTNFQTTDYYFNFTYLDNMDFSMLCYPISLSRKKNIFNIFKVHRRKCGHIRTPRIQRNKIKNLVEQDLKIMLQKEKKKRRFVKLELSYKNISKKINKRLYDEDVIIKKIMSNFLKFVRLLLISITKGNKNKNFNFNNKQFFNVLHSKEFLNENILKSLINNHNKFGSNDISSNKILKYKLIKIFGYFIESNFFHNYLIEKLQKNYDESYLSSFIGYIKKIIS
jgi:hypothetical protein